MATSDKTREARQAARQTRRVPTAGEDQYELTWPYFMYTIVLCFILATAFFGVCSMVMPAPLEPLADLNKTPNPSKAPWYFVGLQELLVYFDPWIAGVVLPSLIIVGLMAIPYLDRNPHGIGEYNYKDRKFAVITFSLGTAFWFILIIVGYFFRGPSWQWYWPWESWEFHKESHVVTHSWSIVQGLLFLACYVGVGLVFPVALPYVLGPKVQEGSWLKKLCNGLQEFYERRGPMIYTLEM